MNYQPALYRPPVLNQGPPIFQVPQSKGTSLVTDGIILTSLGLVSGAVGIWLAQKGYKVIGKKIPTFWEFMFGVGGIGVAMAVLGAIPLVAIGTIQIVGGSILKSTIGEANRQAAALSK